MKNDGKIDLSSLKLRPINLSNFTSVLKWSRDVTFCRASGWDENKSRAEIYRLWHQCVTDPPANFVYGHRTAGKNDRLCRSCKYQEGTAEIGIAIGDAQ